MRPIFRDRTAFAVDVGYQVLPHRSGSLPTKDSVLLTTDAGEHIFLTPEQYSDLIAHALPPGDLFDDLLAKHLIVQGSSDIAQRLTDAKVRSRKAFIRGGQSLHLFVVTLRCNHSCAYCQVSRQAETRGAYDMSEETAAAAVDLLFCSPSPHLTVEFQGGEPLLAFHRIRDIVERIEQRNATEHRSLTYTITSTLQHLTDEVLAFFRKHEVQVSTSLDGPDWLHNKNRPTPTANAHATTVAGIARARAALGHGSVAALTTLTQASLKHPEAIIDEYVRLGFRSVFLRPLSPYGFAERSKRKIGYPMADFIVFYERALAHVLALNRRGVEIAEVYSGVLLSHILTPFHSGYVDLRSPAGAGSGVLAYNYDGGVYASDEGRMLAEMGDHTFRLGSVSDSYDALMASPAMDLIRSTGLAEALTPCQSCVFVPFCGADPVLARASKAPAYRPAQVHCERHMGLFGILFRLLETADPETRRILTSWALRKPPSALLHEAA